VTGHHLTGWSWSVHYDNTINILLCFSDSLLNYVRDIMT